MCTSKVARRNRLPNATLCKVFSKKIPLFNLSKLHHQLRIRPYPLPPIPEENRHRNQRERYESQQAVSPPQPKLVKHVKSSKRQECSEDRPQNSVSGDGGRGVDSERVHEICLDGHHAREVAEPNECGADNGHDPVHAFFGGPGVDEDADGETDSAGK